MGKYRITDEKIQLGYEHAKQNKSIEACDVWLSAWEDIKEMLTAEKSKEIEVLDKKYSWYEFMTNFIQDLEMELNNAGQEKKSISKKGLSIAKKCLKC